MEIQKELLKYMCKDVVGIIMVDVWYEEHKKEHKDNLGIIKNAVCYITAPIYYYWDSPEYSNYTLWCKFCGELCISDSIGALCVNHGYLPDINYYQTRSYEIYPRVSRSRQRQILNTFSHMYLK